MKASREKMINEASAAAEMAASGERRRRNGERNLKWQLKATGVKCQRMAMTRRENESVIKWRSHQSKIWLIVMENGEEENVSLA
jgi:SOS response regulatory protein OraA/RecX